MIELKGKYNNCKVFTDNIDSETISQLTNLLNQEFVSGGQIRIMPDTHAGKGFGNVKEEKVSISKYNESTQTYYVNEALAKQHVRQISKEDIKTVETKKTLDSCMKELEKKLPKDKWHSKRPRMHLNR